MRARRTVHPLLLDPAYWRRRLHELDGAPTSVSVIPRPDLSGGGKTVVEFRMKAHDGESLWGLLARPGWQEGVRPARLRVVGPSQRPDIDGPTVASGVAEFVLQERAGRRLLDRVLDLVQLAQVAVTTEGIDRGRVTLSCPANEREPDEFLIAEHLLGDFYHRRQTRLA